MDDTVRRIRVNYSLKSKVECSVSSKKIKVLQSRLQAVKSDGGVLVQNVIKTAILQFERSQKVLYRTHYSGYGSFGCPKLQTLQSVLMKMVSKQSSNFSWNILIKIGYIRWMLDSFHYNPSLGISIRIPRPQRKVSKSWIKGLCSNIVVSHVTSNFAKEKRLRGKVTTECNYGGK